VEKGFSLRDWVCSLKAISAMSPSMKGRYIQGVSVWIWPMKMLWLIL